MTGATTGGDAPTHYDTFEAFIRDRVRPLQLQHPDWKRLDGESTGGKIAPFAWFRLWNKTWRVNSDTWFQPLILADEALSVRAPEEVFRVEKTKKTGGETLVLAPDLRGWSRHKYFYIYRVDRTTA